MEFVLNQFETSRKPSTDTERIPCHASGHLLTWGYSSFSAGGRPSQGRSWVTIASLNGKNIYIFTEYELYSFLNPKKSDPICRLEERTFGKDVEKYEYLHAAVIAVIANQVPALSTLEINEVLDPSRPRAGETPRVRPGHSLQAVGLARSRAGPGAFAPQATGTCEWTRCFEVLMSQD